MDQQVPSGFTLYLASYGDLSADIIRRLWFQDVDQIPMSTVILMALPALLGAWIAL